MTTNSIADFSFKAAKRYIQSAVFIDDNIFNQVSANPDEIVNVTVRQPKVVFQAEQSDPTTGAELSDEELIPDPPEAPKRPFRTKDLVGSFAEHGIICALYEPERNFQTGESSTIYKLCQTADLVILDWDFHEVGVEGIKPKALIEELIRNGNREAPHQVRLIAIYTNTQNLGSIANSIFQHLTGVQINADPVDACAFRLQAGSSRVLVLGKAGGVTRVEPERQFTVTEAELALRLLNEFASMNQGILPSCALFGMAAVRKNSRRILDRFRSSLDAQFLLQRALIRSSEEAFEQLPDLLGDEFRAVIEDADYRPDDATRFVTDSCADVPIKPHSNPWKVNGQDCHVVLRGFWGEENALSKPINGKPANQLDGPQPKRPIESLAEMCSVVDPDAHRRFAALLATRTQYQTKHRDLGFGAIVLNRSTQEFSICIVPPCDSLRLKAETDFPFWRLSKVGRGEPVIIQRDDGQLLNLVFQSGKPSRFMWMAPFTPDETKNAVTAVKDAAGKHIFNSKDIEYEWIAQLKSNHAQRIANAVGQQLSRVGLTEAEWARIAFSIQSESV